MSEQPWSEIGGGFTAGVVTAVTSCVAWFNRKVGKVHGRINELSEQVGGHQADIAVLQTQHEDLTRATDRIEVSLADLGKKQDRMMELFIKGKDRA